MAILIIERVLIASERRLIVLALEVKIAHLNILHRLQRIPGMEFLHARVVQIAVALEIRDRFLAGGVVLVVVLGRAEIDSRIAARALLGPAIRRGRLVRRILRKRNRRQQNSCQHRQKSNQKSSAHTIIVSLYSTMERQAASPVHRRAQPKKRTGRPLFGTAWFGKILRGGGKIDSYNDGGFVALAVGVGLAAGTCAGVTAPSVLVISRISTRRFLARPSGVLLLSTGLSLPSPIR